MSKKKNDPRWQFGAVDVSTGVDDGFMLNTDFEVFYDLKLVRKSLQYSNENV